MAALPEAISRWPDFRDGGTFPARSAKKTLLHDCGCIFSRPPIVQVVAFRLFSRGAL